MALITLNCRAFKSSDCRGGNESLKRLKESIPQFLRFSGLRFKLGLEVAFETPVTIRSPPPFGNSKGIMLVGCSTFGWEGLPPCPVPRPKGQRKEIVKRAGEVKI
jgi:hypothetical protein